MCRALRSSDYDKLVKSTAIEVSKQQSLGCLGTQVYASVGDLPKGHMIVDAHVIYKDKDDGCSTCRIAGQGQRLPHDPTIATFASVSSDGDKMFTLAMMQAHCDSHADILTMRDFDVVGGFLRIKRTSSTRLFLHLPSTLPHPLAGLFLEVFGALYGLRESNRLFTDEVTRVVSAAGFTASSVSPMTFVKISSTDSTKKCCVNIHVDDFRTLDNDSALSEDLVAALTARFGVLTTHDPCTTFAGIELLRHSNGAISVTQDRYIQRVATTVGVAHMCPVDVPITSDFFYASILPTDCVPVDPTLYQSLTGHLIQVLKTRDEVRPFVSHLCSCNAAPTYGDYSKALHVLRYLHSTPGMGRVFKSKSTQICGTADAAFALHKDGCSSGAFFLSVGADNAPFHTEAKAQLDVATCPMTAEYYSAGASCQALMHFRQLSADLGWPCDYPSPLFVDNKTAINLAEAPEVSRKSRHIEVKHHYIRQLSARKLIQLFHVSSDSMRADILTKYIPRVSYHRKRDILLNRQALNGCTSP